MSILPTFADYLAARRRDPRYEHAVIDQWDRASRDFTHPECETARMLMLRWLTWSNPRLPNRFDMRNIDHLAFEETSTSDNETNIGSALENARSEIPVKEKV